MMSVVRVVNADAVKPLHVVLVCLLGATLAGNCLLTSGPLATIEGAKDWSEESVLRAIVHVLNLSYTQTTSLGVEIKTLAFGIGVAAAAAAAGVALIVRSPGGEEPGTNDRVVLAEGSATGAALPLHPAGRQLRPLPTAQVMMVLYVAWSFASAAWSDSPELAIGGSTWLAMGAAWALVLGRGLGRSTAHAGAQVLALVCVMTGMVAIAYFGERNSLRRASYPIGNPLFLAACVMPGLLVAAAQLGCVVRAQSGAAGVIGSVGRGLLWAGAVAVAGWTIHLTGSRSALVALAAGGMTGVIVLTHGRMRMIAVGSTVVAVAAGVWLYVMPQFSSPSLTGRDASLRVRGYAWGYATELIEGSILVGRGQGGFVRLGDSLVQESEAQADPIALDARLAHAHNEWLEVWADLGLVGLMLLLGSLGLTLWGGVQAMGRLPRDSWRWTLAGLVAALAALMVEESSDVGLRIEGLPALFYGVLGLVWALSRDAMETVGPSTARITRSTGLRRVAGTVCLAAGVAIAVAVSRDFSAGRALYEVTDAVRRRDQDAASRLADWAVRGRISPQRQLEARYAQCSAQIYMAREFQSSCVDRLERSRATDPPNAQLAALAQADREAAESAMHAARQALSGLLKKSPRYFGSGWLEFRLYQLRTVFLRMDGDAEGEARGQAAATEALRRERSRRPTDPMTALTYARMIRGSSGLVERMQVLAVSLRHSPMPVEFAEFLSEESADPAFDAEFLPAVDAATRGRANDPEASIDPYVPEKLRLAAHVQFLRGGFEQAVLAAQDATRWYDWLSAPIGTLGRAACLFELADYELVHDPDRPAHAVRSAEKALSGLPDSTPGRTLRRSIEDRLVTYHLAAGDEAAAETLLRTWLEGLSDEAMKVELGDRYAQLCRALIGRPGRRLPEGFGSWVGRAQELSPTNELVWRLTAQVEFDAGRPDESVSALRKALSQGSEPQMVYAFVRLALNTVPDHAGFRSLEEELRSGVMPALPEQGADAGGESSIRQDGGASEADH